MADVMERHWKRTQSRWLGYQCIRKDGVVVSQPTARSRFRVHRPNAVGFGFEDLVGPKGTALTFKTVYSAMEAANQKWPMAVYE